MRIESTELDASVRRRRKGDVERLLGEPSSREVRPCDGCIIPCPCSGSPTCACRCESTCPDALEQMSSDPDQHPIEPGIAPLVYGLYALRLIKPCWSCEGHYGPGGRLYRVPSVWFRCDSGMYSSLIADYLNDLHARRATSVPWCVKVVSLGEHMQTSYAIEPNIRDGEDGNLAKLQRDVKIIGAGIEEGVRRLGAGALSGFGNEKTTPF